MSSYINYFWSPANLVWARLANDFVSFAISGALLAGYEAFLRYKTRRNPTYTFNSVNNLARSAWVEAIMTGENKEILAVQTLRNSTMTATFMASTAVLLIIGVLTLSGQGSNLSNTWHVLNTFGSTDAYVWLTKLLFLLVNFFVAFFSFLMATRLFNHVGFMINVPISKKHKPITPRHVAFHLNRAGSFLYLGMRAYYYGVPLVFWLFGPHFMLFATIGLIIVMYRQDRAPNIMAADYS